MSVFTKAISHLTTDDINDLLADNAVENARLEFKSTVPDKDETLKKISAFANTFGGLLIVGAQAASKDGRLQALPGVPTQAGYKQKVVQWCFDGAMPPLEVEVSDPIPAPGNSNGMVIYVVSVKESDVAPHFLNGRKGVYVRADEFSGRFEAYLAEERELAHLFNRRKFILERRDLLLKRARGRFDHYYLSSRGTLGPRLEIAVVPRFPSRQLCAEQQLSSFLNSSRIDWRQAGFPKSHSDGISQHESVILLDAAVKQSLLEANTWGLLFYGVPVDYTYEGVTGIHLHALVGYILVFLRHAAVTLSKMGYDGPIILETSLAQIRDVKWLHASEGPWLSTEQGSPIDNNVLFSIDTTSALLSDKPAEVVSTLLRYLLFSVNMARFAIGSGTLDSVIAGGYKYNSW